MLTYLILGIVFVVPAMFWRYGKRWFGSQTHPAALFILAWIATSLLFSSSGAVMGSSGMVALLWVVISFGVMALFDRFRRKPHRDPP